MMVDGGGGAEMQEATNDSGHKGHADEVTHLTGRLYETARKLLTRKPADYLRPDALEIELAKLYERRGYKPQKCFSQKNRDDCLRNAAARAREDFTHQANGGAQSGAGAESTDDANSPYFEHEGSIWHRKFARNAEAYSERLANFTAHIEEERAIDDGGETRRAYLLRVTALGRRFEVKVPAAEFASMNWVSEHLPASVGVLPGRGTADHAQWAIRQLSTDHKCITAYGHSGLRKIDDVYVYLYAGGALSTRSDTTRVETELPDALRRFILPEPPIDPYEAIAAAAQLLDLADARITAPVFGAIWRAPLGEADFSLHIAGASGAFKTELAALAQGHFGAGFDAHHLPCDWTWTENALEELAYATKDALLVIDDFRPPTDYRERDALMRKAERLFRAQGNRQGRGRLSREARLREARPPRGVIIATGEIYPRGQSLAGRILFVDLVSGEIEPARLTACQHDRDAGRYASAMSAYICWLLPRLGQTQAGARQLAADITAAMRSTGLHARTPGVLAELMAGAACFLAFAIDRGAITPSQADALELRIWLGLRAVGGGQAEHQMSQDPARRFIELLTAALASGSAHVATTEGSRPVRAGPLGWRENGMNVWEAKGPRIGWIDDEGLYLEPDAAYKAAASMVAGDGGITIGATALWKRLNEARYLATIDETRQTLKVRRLIEGERRSVIHMFRAAYHGGPCEKPDQPDQPDHKQRATPGVGFWRCFWSGFEGSERKNPTTNNAHT